MISLKPLLVLLVLGAEALGAASPSLVCATDLGTKTLKNVPTTTLTSVNRITIINRIIRKVNVIVVPVAKTTTIRTTVLATSTVTAARGTKTATETVISDFTVLSTRTSTTTNVITSTTTTTKYITTTVPANPGFVAVLKDPSYIVKRAEKDTRAEKDAVAINPLAGLLGSGAIYPQRVRCEKKILSYSTKVVSTTVQGPRITLKAATKTKMSTVTTTLTSTRYPPDFSTTVTTTLSSTSTSYTDTTVTNTITGTVTVEKQIPQETVYAACSSDNILLTANGGGPVVTVFLLNGDDLPTQFGDDDYTPSGCCAECAQRPNCRTSVLDATEHTCYLVLTANPSKCANGQQPLLGQYVTSNRLPRVAAIYSNGPCGTIKNGGTGPR